MFPTISQPLSNYILFILIYTVYTLHHSTSLLFLPLGIPMSNLRSLSIRGHEPNRSHKATQEQFAGLATALQHRTRTSWENHFTHGPVLIQLFLLHMQGLSDAQRLEDQRWCPNVPHLSQCNWETWRRYVSWVALRVAELLLPSNHLKPLEFSKVSPGRQGHGAALRGAAQKDTMPLAVQTLHLLGVRWKMSGKTGDAQQKYTYL